MPIQDARGGVKVLLALSLSSPALTLKDAAGELLLALVRGRPRRLAHHLGYGAAAGVLVDRGLLGEAMGDDRE